MPKFDVVVTRTLQVSATITVTAKNEEEAENKACKQGSVGQWEWSIQDKNDWQEDSDDIQADQVDEA